MCFREHDGAFEGDYLVVKTRRWVLSPAELQSDRKKMAWLWSPFTIYRTLRGMRGGI